MAQEFSRAFYDGSAWRQTRRAYLNSRHGLCERCGEVACIVHHKTHLTAQNMADTDITLGWDNLQALCRDCHAVVHGYSVCAAGVAFDENGNVVKK